MPENFPNDELDGFLNHPVTGVKLPFLNDKKWPVIREDEERVANPSYDTQLQDHLVEEIMDAIDLKDSPKLTGALKALIENILNEGHDEM